MGDFDKWRTRRSSLSVCPSRSLSPSLPLSPSASLSHSALAGVIGRGGLSRFSLSFSSTLFLVLLLLISAAMVAPTASQAPGSQAGDGDGDGDSDGLEGGDGSSDCGPSNLTGYVCAKSIPVQSNTNLRIEVHWAYPVGDELRMAVVANSEGWIGIGWGTQMVRSHSVIGIDEVSAKYLTSYSPDSFMDIPTGFIDAASSSITRGSGITTMKFTRLTNFSTSPVYLNNTSSSMIYAIGESQVFAKHIHEGEFTVKLAEVLTAAPSVGAPMSSAPVSSLPPTAADPSASTLASDASPSGPGSANPPLALTSCNRSSLPGLTCSMGLEGGPTLHWNPPTANGGMEMALEIVGRKSWAAVGWTKDGRMRGDAVIAGKDPKVGVYRIESEDASTIVPSTSFNISNASWNVTDTSSILRFARQVDDGSVPPNQPGVQLMWAHAKPSDTGFDYHGTHKDAISQSFWTEASAGASAEASPSSVASANSIDPPSVNSVDIGGNRKLQWSSTTNGSSANAQSMVQMSFQVPETVAWISVGWNQGGRMAGNCVIGMASGTVTTYKIVSKSQAGIVPTQDFSIVDPSITSSNGVTVLRFTRAIDGVDFNENGTSGLIWAHAQPGSSGFEFHGDNEGSVKIELASGQVTGSSSSEIPKDYYYAHGWLMWIAFGVLFPAGIFLARYGKRWDPMWFNAHVAIQLLAVVVATAGFSIAVKEFDALDELHGRLGIAVMLLVWMQPMIGLGRPHKGTQQRVPWYFVHWLFGTSAVFLGILDIFFGINLLDKIIPVSNAIKVLFSLEVAVVLAAYLLFNELPYILSQSQSPQQKLASRNIANIAMTSPTEG